MIDEAFDTEFETRLRATLDEMIPKLVASEAAGRKQRAESTADELMLRRSTPPARGSRRFALAMLAVAATVLGLIAIARRDTGGLVPGDDSSAADASPPAWYDLIAPSLPERFSNVAFTFANDAQLWFVAINPIEGKTLEIQLSLGYSTEPPTTVDAAGSWVETAQGWSVGTPAGLFVQVSCNIGVGGRSFVGNQNYCDFTDGITPFTKDEIRAVANSLATSLDVSIFGRKLGKPSGDTIDTAKAMALISAAVPGQGIRATDMGKGADHIYDAGVGFGDRSPSDTLPPLDATPPRADTSVRILHGVVPAATVASEPVTDLYGDDAAVVSMFGSGGVYVRISTTDSSPDSVTLLAQLARVLIALDPTSVSTGSPTVDTNLATTTTLEQPTTLSTPAGATTTTLGSCGPSNNPPLAVVVNASHLNKAATLWTNLLAANVPGLLFTDPVNAITQGNASRVMALDGFECSAALVAHFIPGTEVERASLESMQASVAGTLPVGTSIVVIIGDDNLSDVTPGVTTTSTSISTRQSATGPCNTSATTAGGAHYTVVSGDYVAQIASKFGTTVEALIAANGWSDDQPFIYPGLEIVLPTVAPSCEAG
jgi:LysM repeat protein